MNAETVMWREPLWYRVRDWFLTAFVFASTALWAVVVGVAVGWLAHHWLAGQWLAHGSEADPPRGVTEQCERLWSVKFEAAKMRAAP